MLTGKRFRMKAATLGLIFVDGKRSAVPIPADSIVEVTGGPRQNDRSMVDVLWEGRALVMFAEDVQECGEEITVKAAGVE